VLRGPAIRCSRPGQHRARNQLERRSLVRGAVPRHRLRRWRVLRPLVLRAHRDGRGRGAPRGGPWARDENSLAPGPRCPLGELSQTVRRAREVGSARRGTHCSSGAPLRKASSARATPAPVLRALEVIGAISGREDPRSAPGNSEETEMSRAERPLARSKVRRRSPPQPRRLPARSLLLPCAAWARVDTTPTRWPGRWRVASRRSPAASPRSSSGSAINLNVHFHTLTPDGVFELDEDGPACFVSLPPPEDEDVEAILRRVIRRAAKLLAAYRGGVRGRGAGRAPGRRGGPATPVSGPVPPRSPQRLLARLATLVPPPRVHGLRYHGVFAPNSKVRKRVVPAPEPVAPVVAPAPVMKRKPGRPKRATETARTYRIPWAELLAKV